MRPWSAPESGRVVVALALWACSSACNAVLGIEPPRPGFLDAGLVDEPYAESGAPAQAGSGEDPDGGGSDPSSLPTSDRAWADWPMPNPGLSNASNALEYTVRVEGVVTDLVTRLEWQQEVDDELRSWTEAAGYCEELDLAGGGFRLPSRIELISLIDFTRANPSIDPSAFPRAPLDRFWSASPFAEARSSVWLVNFEFGTGFTRQAHVNEKHRVRCVR